MPRLTNTSGGSFMENCLTIYHGSPKIIQKPVFGYGNKYNDYGMGFYCTESMELAKEWACSLELDGYANSYSLNMSGLSVLQLTAGEYNILNWLYVLLQIVASALMGRLQSRQNSISTRTLLSTTENMILSGDTGQMTPISLLQTLF